MNFASTPFFLFLAFVFFSYWHMHHRYQNFFLLVASYFFYACWDWRFLGLILISTIVNFICGPRIYHAKSISERRCWLTLSIIVTLGLLAYFKYANFFVDSFVSMADYLGWHVSEVTMQITLPVGISFFTFQSLSYSLDIYNRKLKPTNSFIDFAAFVAFFPQLVAGPIVRARQFLYQLEAKRTFQGKDFEEGCLRFLTGYFKKVFIADTLAINLVDPVFSNPGLYSTGTLWLALFGYTIQIYADFSGYSNMAIGAARMLGFRIPENFLFPYLATNFSEFWKRWHITMSSFFRDYVYIPLGGNRCGKYRILSNLAITTLVSGLWHGPSWTFVCWGGLHGSYIIADHLIFGKNEKNKIAGKTPWRYVQIPCAWFVTQLLVCLAWVVFRASNFETARIYLSGLIGLGGHEYIVVSPLVWCCFIAFLIDHSYGWLNEIKFELNKKIYSVAQPIVYTVMIVFLYHAVSEKSNPFIYFQF